MAMLWGALHKYNEINSTKGKTSNNIEYTTVACAMCYINVWDIFLIYYLKQLFHLNPWQNYCVGP